MKTQGVPRTSDTQRRSFVNTPAFTAKIIFGSNYEKKWITTGKVNRGHLPFWALYMTVKDEKRWPCENKRLILFNYIKYSFINRGKKSLLVSFSNVPHHIFCFHVLASVRLSWTPSKPTCPTFLVMGTVAIFTHLPLLTAYRGLLFINFKLFLSCEARYTNKNTQSDRHCTYPTWLALHAGMKSNGFPAISNFSTSNYLTNRKKTKNQKTKHLPLKWQLAAPKGHISHRVTHIEV